MLADVLDVEFLSNVEDALNRNYFRVYYRRNGSTYSHLFVMERTGEPIPIAFTHHGRSTHSFVPGDRRWEQPPEVVFDSAITVA